MGRFPDWRSGKYRQPVLFVPVRPPSEVGNLHHYCRTVFMNGIGQFLEPRDDFVTVGVEVPEGLWAVRRYKRRPGCHCQGQSTPGLFSMIELVAFLGESVFGI